MIFGTHADIIPKQVGGSYASGNTYFTDYTYIGNAGNTGYHSEGSNDMDDGISCIQIVTMGGTATYGARIMYNGDESTVNVIDDDTEEL